MLPVVAYNMALSLKNAIFRDIYASFESVKWIGYSAYLDKS